MSSYFFSVCPNGMFSKASFASSCASSSLVFFLAGGGTPSIFPDSSASLSLARRSSNVSFLSKTEPKSDPPNDSKASNVACSA